MARKRLDRKREKQSRALEGLRSRLALSDEEIQKTAKRFKDYAYEIPACKFKEYRKSVQKQITILEDKGVK